MQLPQEPISSSQKLSPQPVSKNPSKVTQDSWVNKIPIRMLSYYGTIYLFLVLVILIFYPLTVPLMSPIVSLVFPMDPRNSLIKLLLIYTLFFWGNVGFKVYQNRGK